MRRQSKCELPSDENNANADGEVQGKEMKSIEMTSLNGTQTKDGTLTTQIENMKRQSLD